MHIIIIVYKNILSKPQEDRTSYGAGKAQPGRHTACVAPRDAGDPQLPRALTLREGGGGLPMYLGFSLGV